MLINSFLHKYNVLIKFLEKLELQIQAQAIGKLRLASQVVELSLSHPITSPVRRDKLLGMLLILCISPTIMLNQCVCHGSLV